MNWVDAIIVGVFIFYLYEGIQRGFIEQVLELAGFVLTVFLALLTYKTFGGWVQDHIGVERFAAEPIAFFAAWFFFQVIYAVILRLTYPLIPAFIRGALPNRLAGIVPAFLKAFVIVAIILTVIILLPVPGKLKSEIDSSKVGRRFVANSSKVEGYLNRVFGRDFKQSLTFLTVPAQTEEIIAPDEKVDLKFSTDQVKVDYASEAKMLVLINEERVKVGLLPLKLNEKASEVARKHSQDMFERGYFAHENPDGLSPFDRQERAGVKFKAAGENIAYAASLDLAHNGLMRSPGHRANILGKDFGQIGIGVIDGGIYGKMFTQNFLD